MQVAIFTGSREAEQKMLSALDALAKVNAGIEARILPKDCTEEYLKTTVENSTAEVFLIGSSMANTLSAHVANYADGRPVIGVPLQNVNDILPIHGEQPTVCNPYSITEAEGVKAAAELAATIIKNLQEARAS